MTDGYALLRAIEANPDEDTPRLVYADWLEEHADTDAERARAEFIRVQCQRARLAPRSKRRAVLAEREMELLEAHGAEWKRHYPIRLAPDHVYIRGFVSPNLTAVAFVERGEALAAVAPVDTVRLRNVSRAPADVAACPVLRHVRNLHLESNALRNHLPKLLGSPHLVNVRLLALSYNQIGPPGCAALAASTALPALRALALNDNPIADRGLEALTRAPWFAQLTGLYVSNCRVSAAGAIRLAGLPAARQLLNLDVSGPSRNDATARAILDSPHLSKLVRLWHPDFDLSEPVRAALRKRFGANLNLRDYQLDRFGGGSA